MSNGDDLTLTTRASNALAKSNITLDSLSKISLRDLLTAMKATKGVGEKTINEIVRVHKHMKTPASSHRMNNSTDEHSSTTESTTESTDKSNSIYVRIQDVMRDVKVIGKTGKAPSEAGGYSYVEHDQVVRALNPLLAKYGIVVIPSVTKCEQERIETRKGTALITTVQLTISFVNADNPIDRVTIQSYGQGIDRQDKGIGKAVTYAFKYGLLKMFCLETGSADDIERESIDITDGSRQPDRRPVPEEAGGSDSRGKAARRLLYRAMAEWMGVREMEVLANCEGLILSHLGLKGGNVDEYERATVWVKKMHRLGNDWENAFNQEQKQDA